MKKVYNIIITLLIVILGLTGCSKSIEEQVTEQLDLGQRYLEEQQYTEAIVAFNKAIELDPKQEAAYFGLVEAYTGTEQFQEAFQIAQAGYELFPNQQFEELVNTNCLELIRFYLDSGEKEKAIEFLEEQAQRLEISGELKRKLAGLGFLVGDDGMVKEYRWGDEWNTLSKMIFDGNAGGMESNAVNMTYDEIRSSFEPLIPRVMLLIEIEPEDSGGYRMLGELYLILDRMDECLAIRTKGYEITGDERLNPNGSHDLPVGEDMTDTWDMDGWGREIGYTGDWGHGVWQYGEGNRVIHHGMYWDNDPQASPQFEDYEYDAQGRVSRIIHGVESSEYKSFSEYQYNNDGTYQIISKNDVNEGYITGSELITRNEYGMITDIKMYDADNNLTYSDHREPTNY